MSAACQAYDPDAQACKNGFIQKPYCSQKPGCWSCGTVSERELPYCLRDELPAHFIRDDGSPAFHPRAPDTRPHSERPSRDEIQRWRDNALEASAAIVKRYVDLADAKEAAGAIDDILALHSDPKAARATLERAQAEGEGK